MRVCDAAQASAERGWRRGDLPAVAIPDAGVLSAQLRGKLGNRGGAQSFMRDRSADGRCKEAAASAADARCASFPPLVLAIGLLLGGCSSGSDSSFSLFAEPGKYQFHSCEQIAAAIKTWSAREQELKTLMDRADQSAGGSAIGLIAYKADYVAAGEEIDELKATARSKKCEQAASWRSDGVIR
jgi:hypothetical protein